MDEQREKFQQILDRYSKLGWMPKEDLDWLIEALATMLSQAS
jgi:hypothetical protein